MTTLHLHRFGPPDQPAAADAPQARPRRRSPDVLALHGLTGHGRRWERLAHEYLQDLRIIAPDLRGHGRSPWQPPWTVAAQVSDLADLLQEEAEDPVVVVGHSYGGNIAVRLARAAPERVRALVLLDPAMGLDPRRAQDVADAYLHSPDYPDAAAARADKLSGGWADVPEAVLDADIAEHLIPSEHGGVTWRVCAPAMVAAWGEMALPAALPPSGMDVFLLRAQRVQPPFLADDIAAQWRASLGDALSVLEADCEHMVSQSHPTLVARLVRRALDDRALNRRTAPDPALAAEPDAAGAQDPAKA